MVQDLYVALSCPSPAPSATLLLAIEYARNSERQTDAVLYRVNKDVFVRLKWGEAEYKGRLVSVDSYYNIQLSNAEEYIAQKFTGSLGEVLIRCSRLLLRAHLIAITRYHADRGNRPDNVLWIRGADQGEQTDSKMEDE
jgi:small nuclear ribonucleoprotein F